jgi:acetyl esterase/lipase
MAYCRRLAHHASALSRAGASEPSDHQLLQPPTPALHPETAGLLAMLDARPRVDPATQLISVVREGYDSMLEAMFDSGLDERLLSSVACELATVIPQDAGGVPVPVRVYVPPAAEAGGGERRRRPLPVLQYMHGGGWTQGCAAGYDGFTRALCARGGFAVVSVDYRLAPEHPSPAAAEDCMAVLRWLVDGAEGCAVLCPDAGRLALAGDSAGGHLTAVTALAAKNAGIELRLQMPLCPATDLRGR